MDEVMGVHDGLAVPSEGFGLCGLCSLAREPRLAVMCQILVILI